MISSEDYIIYFYFGLMFLYYASYLLLYFKFLGASYYVYFIELNTFIQLFIAILLLIRYNPLQEKFKLSKSDSHLIFASACFIIINVGILQYFSHFLGTNKFVKQMQDSMKLPDVSGNASV